MTSPLDRYRTAKTLIQQYGAEDALLMAAKRCDLFNRGESNGSRGERDVGQET
jgi:hypothetical protein